ncbi:hypothetical protein EVAR_43880_1 [Eumeta japonica]|uniref:Uncharacterized protein n=1 Tax=Eumeta variegata TaxID=151549 RepID=A0A4C1WQR9_EUMVA|nr:hypothetical protein EVAR_43880_1 [Eumeta japonica]
MFGYLLTVSNFNHPRGTAPQEVPVAGGGTLRVVPPDDGFDFRVIFFSNASAQERMSRYVCSGVRSPTCTSGFGPLCDEFVYHIMY